MTLSTAIRGQIAIDWADQRIALETQWLGAGEGVQSSPIIVFLHEGLGSVAMWKDFPQQLCEAARCRGLVISRPGYGWSTPLPMGTRWGIDFLERQALEVLPAAFKALGIVPQAQDLWLMGHSDGASIALIYASEFHGQVSGVVALAPHCFVEAVTVSRIAALKAPQRKADLLARLAPYHQTPEPIFDAWSTIWLDPAFSAWSITDRISHIDCPVLAVQGQDDEYGSLEQIRCIGRALPGARLVELASCGHSPHRDMPQTLVTTICNFLKQNEGDFR